VTAPAGPPPPPFPGTKKLDRPLTDAEKRDLAKLLRAHDFEGARLIATRFAYRKTYNMARARDLVGAACQALVEYGWDPARVSLIGCLNRFVWRAWTHELREARVQREAEIRFLEEQAKNPGTTSPEKLVEIRQRLDSLARLQRRKAEQALARMRAAFEKAGDEVNLLRMDFEAKGILALDEMARLRGREASEFYIAAKRRKRLILRLRDGEGGVN